MRRLLAAGLLPERAGQPVRALVHVPLADLMRLDSDSVLMQEWTAQVRPAGRAPGRRVGGRQRRRGVAGRRRRPDVQLRRVPHPGRHRGGQPGARLGGPSLPLDVGVSCDIPAAIRRAVILRDQHCRFPGGCDQPAAACEVRHLTRKADGGKTSVKDCALFCFFHHQVVIHQQGWTVVLNPDGTTTAWNKNRTKVLHSHGPDRPG